jgi:hypothetical protein
MAEFLQSYLENQKNVPILLEPLEWLKLYLSDGKMKNKNGFKYEVVGEANTSLHDEILTEPHVELLDFHDEGV